MVPLLAPLFMAQFQLQMPPTLPRAMLDARISIDCVAGLRSERAIDKMSELELRDGALWLDAVKVWGNIETGEELLEGTVSCGPRLLATRVARATAALDRVERIHQQAILPLKRGAWIGALKLCADSVTRIERGEDPIAGPAARITLTPPARLAFAGMTDAFIARPIAIRVNGEIISEPRINERQEDGVFLIIEKAPAMYERLRAAVAEPC